MTLAKVQGLIASGGRPPIGETWIVKQLLDIGAQTLLIPMVDSKAMAQQVRTLDKARLNARAAGAVQGGDMRRLDDALRLHLGL